jgi:hypothetical protein
MTTYKVRQYFVIHLNGVKYREGAILDLSDEEYQKVLHQVEAVPPAKKQSTKQVKENVLPDLSSP